jgi:hypothetical protein
LRLDPIRFEVIRNLLVAAVDEAAWLFKTRLFEQYQNTSRTAPGRDIVPRPRCLAACRKQRPLRHSAPPEGSGFTGNEGNPPSEVKGEFE